MDQIEEAVDQLDWEVVLERAQAVLALDRENKDAHSFLDAPYLGSNISLPRIPVHLQNALISIPITRTTVSRVQRSFGGQER